MHWIDSETQALLDSLVESLPTARLLLLVNYRPEYQHGWGSKTFYTQLRLDPLPPASADDFLQALLGDDPSLVPLKKLLIARTEGNPFFLEESVRTLVETRVLAGEPGAYRLMQDVPAIQVPPTVQAVLAARIDRLPQDDKRLLQTAAVIGHEVPLPLLQTIAEMPAEVLHRGLTHLQAVEFLYETSLFPERLYTFKHALTHEVAYSSLLQERRRLLHARIVTALETLSGDQAAEQVERLAHHAFRGEVWDKALTYFRQAGSKAMARSAHQEAVTCFESALEALRHLPTNKDTMALGIDVRLDLRNALLPLGEHDRILITLQETERLVEALHDPYRLAVVYTWLTHYFWSMRNLDRALVCGQRALAAAEPLGDVELYSHANHCLAEVYYSLGHYGQAMAAFEQNVVRLTGDLLHARFHTPAVLSVVSRRWLVHAAADMGAFTEGVARGDEAVRIAEEAENPYSLANACWGLGYLYVKKGEFQKTVPLWARALELCRVWNLRQLVAGLTLAYSHALAWSGQYSEALALLQQSIEATLARESGRSASFAFMLSELHWLGGHDEEAHPLGAKAYERARETKERGHEAYALRLLGDIARQRHPQEIDQAKTYYQQALAPATELGMRPLQAHCHRGLGTLYSQTGQSEHARAALYTALDMYREMAMTFWLPETEAALAEVKKL